MSPDKNGGRSELAGETVLFGHDCYLVLDKVWPGLAGKLYVTPTRILWLPRGQSAPNDQGLVLELGDVSHSELVKARLPWFVPPVAVFAHGLRIEFFLSKTVERELAEELAHLITQRSEASQPSKNAITHIPIRRARLFALFWLANISLVGALIAYASVATLSVISFPIVLAWLAIVVRTVTTAIPLLVSKKAANA
jgi:hypothetical protein